MQNEFEVAKKAAVVGDGVDGEGAVQDEAVGRGPRVESDEVRHEPVSCDGALLCRRCAAGYLSVSPDTFGRHVVDHVPRVEVIAGVTRWARVSLDDWVASKLGGTACAANGSAAAAAAGTNEKVGVQTNVSALPQIPVSLARAARLLGRSKTRTLLPAIDAGLIRTIKQGKRLLIPPDEMRRLAAEGIGPPPRPSRPSRPSRRRCSRLPTAPRDLAGEAASVLALQQRSPAS